MPEFGWQAQWDRGDSAAGRQPPDHRARLTEILAQVSRDVLQAEGLAGRRVAVEVNGAIVPRSRHGEHVLEPGDRVEIVHALGGG